MAATAATADVSTNNDSPRSPSKHRGVLSSPWAQVVKGAGEIPEKSESPPPENFPASEGNVGKKPAWNKPANAISPPLPPSPPPSGDQPVVMGAAAWPALSESTRLPLKSSSSSSDSPKSTPEVSVPVTQGPVISNTQPPKQGNANIIQNSSISSAPPARQRSMKRGGGGGNRQGGFTRGPPPPPPMPAFSVPEVAQSSFSKVMPVAGPDSSFRETRPTGGYASHPNPSNEHHNQRSSNRRGNYGQHGRGDGRNNYHGGRRDQDHGNHDWSSSSTPHARGSHGHPHRPHGRGFMGPPVQGAPQYAPPPVRPYGNAFLYPDPGLVYYYPPLPSDSFRGMPYITTGPPPPPYLVASDPLRLSIVQQIEYYFSDANLVKDEFLRSKMDQQGWVPITLIASFPRVQNLTESVPFILDCLRGSSFLEVQGDKLRRCDDWMKWIPHQRSPPESGSQSPVGSYDNLTTDMQRVSLENQDNTSGTLKEKELSNNLRVTNMEGSVQRVC